MFSTRFPVIALVALFALAGCGRRDETTSRRAGGGTADSSEYRMETVERKEGHCGPDSVPCVAVRFDYPHLTSVPAGDAAALNASILEMLPGPYFADGPRVPVAALADSFVVEYRTLVAGMPDYKLPWQLEGRAEVVHNSKNLLSLRLWEMAFTGGAHPNSTTRYVTLDLATGRALKLDDVLIEGGRGQLQALAERRFRHEQGIPEAEGINSTGFTFESDRFSLPESFAITRDGLLFHYNPYEIAPYSRGPTQLLLPCSDVKALLRADRTPCS